MTVAVAVGGRRTPLLSIQRRLIAAPPAGSRSTVMEEAVYLMMVGMAVAMITDSEGGGGDSGDVGT